MMRLTRQEAAFVAGLSYRKLSEKLRRMDGGKYQHSLLSDAQLANFGINAQKVEEAFARAKKLDWQTIVANCRQCTKLNRYCNEHKGMLTFLPKQLELKWE